MSDILEQVKKIEEAGVCAKCSCELTDENRGVVAFIVVIDSIPGGAGEKVNVPMCKECRGWVKAFSLAQVHGTSLRTREEEVMEFQLHAPDLTAHDYHDKVIRNQKRQEQPWRDHGRSKKDRRHHR